MSVHQVNDTATIQRMFVALQPVLTMGPSFIAGEVPADEMANTMVAAAEDYAAGTSPQPTAETRSVYSPAQLQEILAEIHNCGSGYLEQRCDADCVVRTMRQMVHAFY